MRFPHCDAKVLHAPGKCQFCDMSPEWQELRKVWSINFTGEHEVGKLVCPSEQARSLDIVEKWPGNRAYPASSWTPTPVGNLYSKEKTLEYFKAAEAKVTTVCNHDLESPGKTLKATLAPHYGWRCTVCSGEWYP